MGFHLPKVHIPLPSPLKQLAEKKPSLDSIIPALAIVAPVGVLAYEVIKHPDEVKSTLGKAADEIKKDAPVVAAGIGKGAKAVGGAANAVFDKLMFPLMAAGALVLAVLVLKK